MPSDLDNAEHNRAIAPYAQEQLLVDVGPEISGEQILCTSPGLAQFAAAAAQALPKASIVCTYLDLHRANLASHHWRDATSNLRIECAIDLPQAEADAAVFPFSSSGEAELTRELLQAGHDRLKLGGKLYASTDNPTDTWLDDQLRKIFRRIERRAHATGTLYVATKTEPLKKLKDFSCEFAFRDRGRLIRAFSRPGVFSHRHIDPGARHLIDTMDIEPGDRVLDIGCGAGTVALAAACRAEGVMVHAVDSNARAIECTQRGAALNGFTNITTELNADGNYADAGQYDLALANPPYYAGARIPQHFVTAARHALRPGGTLLIVTKRPEWYVENLPTLFDDVSAAERRGYYLFQGVRPAD